MLRVAFGAYFTFLSWQLLTPVTLVSAGGWDKVYHFGAFFCLAGLAFVAWRQLNLRAIFLALMAYAALTEVLQHFIAGRSFSLLDIGADALGIFCAAMTYTWLGGKKSKQ